MLPCKWSFKFAHLHTMPYPSSLKLHYLVWNSKERNEKLWNSPNPRVFRNLLITLCQPSPVFHPWKLCQFWCLLITQCIAHPQLNHWENQVKGFLLFYFIFKYFILFYLFVVAIFRGQFFIFSKWWKNRVFKMGFSVTKSQNC